MIVGPGTYWNLFEDEGHWGRTLFARKELEQVVVPALVSAEVLTVCLFVLDAGRLTAPKIWGFVVGLGGGFLAFVLMELAKAEIHSRLPVRALSTILGPLGALILLPFSPAAAGGYFAGSGVTFCFCWSVAELVRLLSKCRRG